MDAHAESFAQFSPGARPRLVNVQLTLSSQSGPGRVHYKLDGAEIQLEF